jgi:hypothetical protein
MACEQVNNIDSPLVRHVQKNKDNTNNNMRKERGGLLEPTGDNRTMRENCKQSREHEF